MNPRPRLLAALLGLATTTCNNSTPSPVGPGDSAIALKYEYRDLFEHSGWIGTSITAGICSNGLVAWCQGNSWVAWLARLGQWELRIPYVAGEGCKAPLAAPLQSSRLTSGESADIRAVDARCAPNEDGASAPMQVAALPGATTKDALTRTPELQRDGLSSRQYRHILPAGETQVSYIEKLRPGFVGVEFGGNDVLTVQSGVVIPSASYVPFMTWANQYDRLLDRVGAVARQGVLVGLPRDVRAFPNLRYGYELAAERAVFLSAFHVTVDANCDGSKNMVAQSFKVVAAVRTGLARQAAGEAPFSLSCADGGFGAVDFVLTPDDIAVVNRHLALMNAHIEVKAEEMGYAYFELDALYSAPKAPFSVEHLMRSDEPYGPLFSLDGIHPSAAGHRVLAEAAARALNRTYGLAIPVL